MIAVSSANTYYLVLNYAALFPDSKDYASSFYNQYIAITISGYQYYYSIWSNTNVNAGYLQYAIPTNGIAVPVFGNNLQSYSTPYTFSVNLAGFKLYSNQRTTGPFYGSLIQVIASGFSQISGCGVYLYYQTNQPFYNSGLYCIV
jgi:hypothetical protein